MDTEWQALICPRDSISEFTLYSQVDYIITLLVFVTRESPKQVHMLHVLLTLFDKYTCRVMI